MREIKFRGINHETGNFVYGYYTRLIEGVRIIHAIISEEPTGFVRYYIHNPETISQYTGLKDENGKEIYEGDIVKVDLCENYGIKSGMISYVVWNNKFAAFGLKDDSLFDWVRFDENIKVIGNIHENSELLQVTL